MEKDNIEETANIDAEIRINNEKKVDYLRIMETSENLSS